MFAIAVGVGVGVLLVSLVVLVSRGGRTPWE